MMPFKRDKNRKSSPLPTSALAQLSFGLKGLYATCENSSSSSTATASRTRPAPGLGPISRSSSADATKPTKRRTRVVKIAHHSSRKDDASKKDTTSNVSAARRILTKKTQPSGNGGLDNEDQNLIVRVRDVLGGRDATPMQPEFVVLDMLGQGTFGQVFRCQNMETKEIVAVKVIRNHPSYYKQAVVEVQITKMLNASYHEEEAPHFVRLKDTFECRNHLCLIFELLSMNVYELIAENNFNGFPLEVTRGFTAQLLHALVQMEEIGVIHCDLKPENILLVGREKCLGDVAYAHDARMAAIVAHGDFCSSGKLAIGQTPYIKVVDFGSACMENETVYSYIQSRFYRSPEVLLGIPYTGAIDMWSLGCIAVEMFLGLPLFPGVSEHDQLRLIEETLGKFPQELVRRGRNVLKYFNIHNGYEFLLKTPSQFARDTNSEVQMSKKYFKYTKLEDMIRAYPVSKHATESQIRHERDQRQTFLHFVRGLLSVDPTQRWSAREAMQHPFITGAPFVQEEVEFTQALTMASRPGPGGTHLPVMPLPTFPSVVAPHLPNQRPVEAPSASTVWSSPAKAAIELPNTPVYNKNSIWGPSGMPPYTMDGHADCAEQVSPSANHFLGFREGKSRSKVAPTMVHSDFPNSRVYPYDPYGNAIPSRPCLDEASAYSPASTYSIRASPYCKVTPTLSLSSASDGYPVTPLSPYEDGQQDYGSPYHVAQPLPQVVGNGDVIAWNDAGYDCHQTSSNSHGRVRDVPWRYGARESWSQEQPIPHYQQYKSEPITQPHRRGKRQHTSSYDGADSRDPQRLISSNSPQDAINERARLQQQQYQYAQRHLPRPPHTGGNTSRTPPNLPRNNETKSRTPQARQRKTPKSAGTPGKTNYTHHPTNYQSRHRLHHSSREVSEVDSSVYRHSHQRREPNHFRQKASRTKRDEPIVVCSVEEKFSSVMSLDVASSTAVPLPT